MDLIHACCAGLDVHKKTVVACIRRTGPDGAVTTAVRTFGTMTAELLALADWLDAQGVRHVAMESTGVYWKPVFNLLEGRFEVILVNAHQLKQVPGRKTDVKDAEWIAQLLQYGLLSPSFIPPPEIRELRDLTRQRTELVRDRAAVANRIQKVLEDANIKLGDVASDVLGVSGRAMIRAIIDGQDDPERLAELAKRSLRGKIPELKRALHGRVTEHHRFLLRAVAGPGRGAGGPDRPVRGPDRRGDEAAGRGGGTVAGDPRGGGAGGGGDRGGGGPGHVGLRDGGPPELVGGVVPGEQRERRQAAERGRRPRGASGCGRRWCRWPGRPATPRRRSSAPAIGGGRSGWDGRRRWWRWRTRSW